MTDQIHTPANASRIPEPGTVEYWGEYDAGVLSDDGGGNVAWWHDYLRAEIGHANAHWRAAVAAMRPAPAEGWRPIETAPHGVEVLLYCPDRGCASNPERIELACASHGDTSRSYHSWATHWMPLPAAPAQGGEDA